MVEHVEYRFSSQGLGPDEELEVVSFAGSEGISRLYEFTIELKSRSSDLDLDALLSARCSLELSVGGKNRRINGVLKAFEELNQVGEFVLYRAVLVPRLWQLSMYRTNEIYLALNVPDTVERVLQEGGLTADDYELRLQRDYREWAYRCQFGETHLDFISRLLEHEGIYYYFVQDDDIDKLVLCDHRQSHDDLPEPQIVYSPPTNTNLEQFQDQVHSLVCRQSRMPRKVMLRDYNDDNPSVDIKGEAEVDPKGIGEVYAYGENVESPEEGKALAEIRAEEIRAGKRVFYGESTVARLQSGYFCELEQHFREGFNQRYLIQSIEHEGNAPGMLTADEDRAAYRNSFAAIPAEVQHRPARVTPKPRFYGTLNAVVDAEGDGHYAEVDELGRYRVVLSFDREQRQEGKASHWIRMSQPYAGENEGMHFPLRKGAEVLLTFIGGDPDRPVIAGAVPNARHPSVVTGDNQTNGRIQSGGGNYIELEDRDDSRRIKLYSPHKHSYFHIGAPNHAGAGIVTLTEGIERREIAGGQRLTVSVNNFDGGAGSQTDYTVETASDEPADVLDEMSMFQFTLKDSDSGQTVNGLIPGEEEGKPLVDANGLITREGEISGKWLFERRVGDRYFWSEGSEFYYGGGNVFNFGAGGYEETHASDDGIDPESKKYESFGIPEVTGAPRKPEQGFVEKLWGDTYSYQKGNNYSWGDTCDYEFGNSYSEAHVTSDTGPINASHEHDSYKGDDVTIDPEKALVEKTFGDTYSFQKGNALEVVHGNAESRVWGDSREKVDGDSISRIEGDSDERVTGDAISWHFGRSSEMFLGGTAAFYLGGSVELNIAAALETFLGGKVDINVGGVVEIGIGGKLELSLAASEEIDLAVKLKLKQAEVEIKASEVKATVNALVNHMNDVKSSLTSIKSNVSDLNNASINVNTSALTLIT